MTIHQKQNWRFPLLPIILSSILWSPQPSLAKIRVAIDAGHGGFDRGAIYQNVFESKIALGITKKLQQKLRQDPGITPIMIRPDDREVTLHNRVIKAKRARADIFLSIHANSSPNANSKGTEFYVQNQMASEEEGLFLANRENNLAQKSKNKEGTSNVENIIYDLKKTQRILESYQISWHFNKAWGRGNRIRQGPFYVLSQNDIPAVLVEVGYLSHARERKQLQNKAYQNQVVDKIYKGLKEALQGFSKK